MTQRKLLTASGLTRASRCQYWLRGDVAWTVSVPDSATLVGKSFHKFAELYVAGGRPTVEAVVAEYGLNDFRAAELGERCEHFLGWWASLPKEGVIYEPERKFEYDPVERRAQNLFSSGERDYSAASWAPGSICGTVDLVAISKDEITLYDYKTGAKRHEPRGLQFAVAALAYVAMYPEKKVRTCVVSVQPGGITEQYSPVFAGDLLEWAADRVRRVAVFAREQAVPRGGDWCRYCPAAGVCPEGSRLARSAVAAHTSAVSNGTRLAQAYAFSSAIDSRDHAAWLLRMMPLVSTALEAVDQALKRYVDENGAIDLEDGTKYDRRIQGHTVPDLTHPEAKGILSSLGLLGAVQTKETVTWTDLKKTDPIKAQEARARLVAAKAVKHSTRTVYATVNRKD